MSVNDLMDDLEQDVKVMMVDGEPHTIREILDKILRKDKKGRRFSTG